MTIEKRTPMRDWIETATSAELLEGAEYLLKDAISLRERAEEYRKAGLEWLADKVAENAEYSDKMANSAIAKATGGQS